MIQGNGTVMHEGFGVCAQAKSFLQFIRNTADRYGSIVGTRTSAMNLIEELVGKSDPLFFKVILFFLKLAWNIYMWLHD